MSDEAQSDHTSSQDMAHFGIDSNLQACMGEVNELLRRHGLEGKIGLAILHSHFNVAKDEVMFESNDPERRELRFNPVKRIDLDPKDVFVSIWDPFTGEAMGCCPRTHACHEILNEPPKYILDGGPAA